MKILQQKSPFEDWKLEVICTGKYWDQDTKVPCGSKLEIEINDIIKRKWYKYPDYEGTSYGFICPVCGCFSEIEEKYLSMYIKNMAKDYSDFNTNNTKTFDTNKTL
jgi:hypothetical protein